MKTIPECFGGMFPDFTSVQNKSATEGKTFRLLLETRGQQSHRLEMKREECEKCARCPSYQPCYDFSLARLLMDAVLMQNMRVNPWVRG